MRGRIFTDRERGLIQEFCRTRRRSAEINKVCHFVERNWSSLISDFKLLIEVKRLIEEGY